MALKKLRKNPRKKVQGAWISIDDIKLLNDEAEKSGLRSSTSLAAIILAEWCDQKRLESAENLIESMKRKEREQNGEAETAN